MPIYWGDIHAHCAVSYGNGTPLRALNNAREHLDFCSITGHAFWPDLPMDLETQNRIIGMHFGGFAKLQHYWPELMQTLENANAPGEFVTLPSYEWHSMEFGDYNCYFDSTDVKLIDAPTPEQLAVALQKQSTNWMMLPHHCGYVRGYRGINWDAFDPARSPLIEIYSNHGCCEADDAYYAYHHSMGPRVGESTIREGLLKGHRFGFYASTDNHDGYPGHYGHGRVGVLAPRLDRASIWDALQHRRTLASTGAKFEMEVQLGDGRIGEVIRREVNTGVRIAIEGTASIDGVDLIEASGTDWQVRSLPVPVLSPKFTPGRYKVRVECGWGRNGTVSEWKIKANVAEGRLVGCEAYFRNSASEMAEQVACDRICFWDEKQAEWECRTVPNPAGLLGGTHFNAGGTQSVVLEIDANEKTRLQVKTDSLNFDLPVTDLVRHSTGQQVGELGSAAIKIHRAVPQREFSFHHEEIYHPLGDKSGFVYVRVRQTDGQIGWASPIWYE